MQLQTNTSGLIVEIFVLDGVYHTNELVPLLNFSSVTTAAEVRLTGDRRIFDGITAACPSTCATIFRELPIYVFPTAPRVVLRRIVFEMYTSTPVITIFGSSVHILDSSFRDNKGAPFTWRRLQVHWCPSSR